MTTQFKTKRRGRMLKLESLEPRRLLAVTVTEQAQVDITSLSHSSPDDRLGVNPPIDHIIQLSSGNNARLFTNTYDRDENGDGSDIRTVGVATLDNLSQHGYPDFNGLRRDGNRVIALFGVQGASIPGTQDARFTEGAITFYEVPGGGNIDTDDPATYDPANLDLVATYVLKAQALGPGVEPVAGVGVGGARSAVLPGVPGSSQQISPIPAEIVDVSGVNTAIGSLGAGNFTFLEDPDQPNQEFIDVSYRDAGGNQVDPLGRPDLGLTPIERSGDDGFLEGVHAFTRQTVQPVFTLPDTRRDEFANADQQATLNAIAQAAFGDDFAEFGSGGQADWIPLGGDRKNPDLEEGDFQAQLEIDAEPISCNEGLLPDLEIVKKPDPTDVPQPVFGPGDTAYFEITVTNNGPGPAENVSITDSLPTTNTPVWVVASEELNGDAVVPSVCSIDASQELTCNLTELAAGDTFTVKVEATVVIGGTLAAAVVPPSVFNASDGNLLLDNTEIPEDVRTANDIPDNDTDEGYTDWGTFKDEILGDTETPGITAGVVFDLPSGNDDNSYTEGTKNDSVIAVIDDGSIPNNKDDLLRWYYVQEEIGDQVVLDLGWVRDNRLGSAHIDFELNQKVDYPASPDPFFGDWIRNRTEGDALITFDFTGGKRPILGLSRWLTDNGTNTADMCEANNSLPCWGEIEVLEGIAEGAVNFDNSGTERPGDDTYPVYDPIVDETIDVLRFGEASINFTEAIGSPDECTVFTQAHVNSRSSDSFNAALKDLIAPIPVELGNCVTVPNTATVDADNDPGGSDDGGFFVIGGSEDGLSEARLSADDIDSMFAQAGQETDGGSGLTAGDSDNGKGGALDEVAREATAAVYGDVNGDGIFDSSDLVELFQKGEFEDDVEDNSDWTGGDFDGDGDFTTSDLVMAFQKGKYMKH